MDGLSSCQCLTTSHGDHRATRKNVSQILNSVSLYAKRFGAGQWSFLGPGSEKKWYSISEDSPQGDWDKIAEVDFSCTSEPILHFAVLSTPFEEYALNILLFLTSFLSEHQFFICFEHFL